METLSTDNENAILGEFLVNKPKRGKLFDGVTVSTLLYIAFVLADFAVDLDSLSPKVFEWQLAMIILALPFMGIIFHLAGKRMGWIINSFYYLFITLIIMYGFLQKVVEESDQREGPISWRVFSFLALALISTIFLFSNPIRKYFRINTILLIIIPILSLGFTITMVFSVMER